MFESLIGFVCGAFVAVTNEVIQKIIYYRHIKQVSRYLSQALVIVVTSTVTRFLIVASLLLMSFKYFHLNSSYVLLGFVLGQIYFLIHQLLVSNNNGK